MRPMDYRVTIVKLTFIFILVGWTTENEDESGRAVPSGKDCNCGPMGEGFGEAILWQGHDNRTLRIVVLLPVNNSWLFSMQKTLPAIEFALESEQVRASLPGHKINITTADSRCSTVYAPLEAFRIYKSKLVHAFFGPVCDYGLAPVARYVSRWNIPIISSGGLAHDFGYNKSLPESEFPLLTRIGITSFDSLARCFQSALTHHNWTNVKLMSNNMGYTEIAFRFCFLSMNAILSHLKKEGVNYHSYSFDVTKGDAVYETMLVDEIGSKHAIILLCASSDPVRDIMIKAGDLGFNNGEYIFFHIDLFSSKSKLERPWYRANDTDERNEKARKAYESLMTITLRKPDSEDYHEFSKEVKRRARKRYGEDVYGSEEVNSFVGAFHDAVILYALAANETIEAGHSPNNGSEITRRMWNRTFKGITGEVSIDANGDREGDYSILNIDPDTGNFQVVANYYGGRKQYEPVEGVKIHWPGGRTSPPPDVPLCGFDGKGCPEKEQLGVSAIVTAVLGTLLAGVCVVAFFLYRYYKMEAELAEINWRIRWEDILFGIPESRKLERTGSLCSLHRRSSMVSNMSNDTLAYQLSDLASKQVFTKTGLYKAALVAIKKINKQFTINKPLLIQFKKMRDLQNDHIVRFIGVCIDFPNQCIVTEYCQKGSLQDVLENEHIKLDSMFKFSLIQDLVRAISYLHNSDIRVHGNLKSPNCVVDIRFTLKVTDFGLPGLRAKDQDNPYATFRALLWTAPELLRQGTNGNPAEGTQKGDVYSFAIICQEIIHRKGPFWVEHMDYLSPEDIYRHVKDEADFRPTLHVQVPEKDKEKEKEGCHEELANLVSKCWADDPLDRPDFHSIKSILKRMNKEGDNGGNLLDNLLSRMEQYACNLEGLVQERTADYLEQKKRAEDLLYNMLPRSVANILMSGNIVEAEKFDSVTIYFSDICGFTSLSAVSTPMEVVDLLNDLYTAFDNVIDTFDVYKVETIGDAYMVVSGLPVRNENLHAREISRMALRLLRTVKTFKIRHRPGDKLKLRIGIHSGAVCSGVVGQKMPRYCLFGDTVNTASRMESNGEAWMIHVSPCTKTILDKFGTFKLSFRGPVAMKGKGEISTWWLLGEDNPDFPELAPAEMDLLPSINI